MAGVYMHIPFCASKCAYCDFYSLANPALMGVYHEAVAREWECRRHELGAESIETVYFGGGTPSLLPPARIGALASLFPADHIKEFTIEANPESVSEEAVEAWVRAGINRASIGVQSLVDTELRAVGRRHDADTALRAIEILRRGGIANISADLIYGLPGQTVESWERSVDGLLDTGISHLSAYCLGIEPGTRLYMQLQRGQIQEADEETIERMYLLLCAKAASAGMEHYEISNFALPDKRSRHNSAYWTGTPYLGLGPGAHSLGADGVRRYVRPDLRAYIAAPAGCLETDIETDTDRVNDRIMTALRTAEGLDTALLPSDARCAVEARASRWLRSGHLRQNGSRIRVPEERWLTSDAIIRDLFLEVREKDE